MAAVVGLLLIFVVLWDSFETIVLPRRVTRTFRLTRLVRRLSWGPWSASARRMRDDRVRETFLSYYGPLSLILLLVVWAAILVAGFALVYWGLGAGLAGPQGPAGLAATLYMSGSTFFTLGIGDVTPRTPIGQLVTVVEAAIGFAFLAVVIGYLPIFYQAFSRRETYISLLDARAGSPPTAAELLRRAGRHDDLESLSEFLRDWERWSAELLESHLSYPLLAYFRSQHERESWLAALTAILDTCALVMVGVAGVPFRPARLTFAIARHAAVDLCQVFLRAPAAPPTDRLPPADLARLRSILQAAGAPLREGDDADRQLAKLRALYEPYVNALSTALLMPLPPWLPAEDARDDWETSAEEHLPASPRRTTTPQQT